MEKPILWDGYSIPSTLDERAVVYARSSRKPDLAELDGDVDPMEVDS